MRVEVEDLHRVVRAARRGGRRVVLGGHSLGGSITTAYATWDFDGRPGARDLAGLVYIDGGSSPQPVTDADARAALQRLQSGSPWRAFGGIQAPFAGLFQMTGSTSALIDPNARSRSQAFPLLPAELKPPFPVTSRAQFGYALDTATSPKTLAAAQAHLGRLAASGDPRGWDQAGELTPITRYAQMFSGAGLKGLDGTAWYHPLRLTIDAGAVADGNRNAAQKVLGVRATHGDDLPRGMRIYAFAAALGGTSVLSDARRLARQSHLPRSALTLVDRHKTYAHNDPAGASPKNAFVDTLVTWLGRVSPLRGVRSRP
jgi:pimeloyl-ACP methyl ester carboxylesterase